jgi:hypothetical protein
MDIKNQERAAQAANQGSWEDELIGLLRATGEWLERLTGDPKAVNAAMLTLFAEMQRGYDDHPSDWRQAWSEFSPYDLITWSYFNELGRYAFEGCWPEIERDCGAERIDGQTDIEFIARFVSWARSLVDSIPAGWGSFGALVNDVLAAEARLAVDSGKDVAPDQLAALSCLSLKSIKNLVAPGNRSEAIKLNADDKINSADAKRWLDARDDFKPSHWHLRGTANLRVPKAEQTKLDEVLFVPVAKDGTVFEPNCCKSTRGYSIGERDAQENIDDYQEALTRLTRMPTPRWRRRNTLGRWGDVVGVEWARKTRSELGLTGSTDRGAE